MVQAKTNYWGQLTLSKFESIEVSTFAATNKSIPLETNPVSLEGSLKQKSDNEFNSRIFVSAICGVLSLVSFSSPQPTTKNTGVLWGFCSLHELFKPSQAEREYQAYLLGEEQYANYMKKQRRKEEKLMPPLKDQYYHDVETQQIKKQKDVSFDLKGRSEGFALNFGIGILAAYAYITYQESFLRTTSDPINYYSFPIWIDALLSSVVGMIIFSDISEMIQDRLDVVSSK